MANHQPAETRRSTAIVIAVMLLNIALALVGTDPMLNMLSAFAAGVLFGCLLITRFSTARVHGS